MGTENYDTTWSHHFGSFSVYENRPFAFSEKCSNLRKISESSTLKNDARSSSLYVDPLPQKNRVLQGSRLGISFCGWNKGPISITNPNLKKNFWPKKKFLTEKLFMMKNS